MLIRYLRRLMGKREGPVCMEPQREWQVVAVYTPAPKPMVRYDHRGNFQGMSLESIPSSRAGLEFKFTVADADDEVQAVAVVIQSGFFLDGLSKQFGFVAKELA